jgi:hypothetical protein
MRNGSADFTPTFFAILLEKFNNELKLLFSGSAVRSLTDSGDLFGDRWI